MPILTTASVYVFISGAFFGSIVSNLGKSLLDYFWASDMCIRETVRQNMIASDPINLDENDLVPYDNLINRIVSKIQGNTWGIFVFAAPQGTGKSTFVKMAIQNIRMQHPSIKLKLIKGGSSVLQQKNLHVHLRIPSARSLSDFLPPQSVIFIDQIDFQSTESELSEELRLYLTELATDSSNSKTFKIILCVSNAKVTSGILQCNGFEKIQPICSYEDLAWNDVQLHTFIDKKLAGLSISDKEKLKELAATCKNSPGLVIKTVDSLQPVAIGTSISDWRTLERYAQKSEASWKEFEEVKND